MQEAIDCRRWSKSMVSRAIRAASTLLDELLNAQAYRLAFWRVAAEEINYRRFFDMNDLAAIRQEVPEVFETTHRLLLELGAQRRGDRSANRSPGRSLFAERIFRKIAERCATDLKTSVPVTAGTFTWRWKRS